MSIVYSAVIFTALSCEEGSQSGDGTSSAPPPDAALSTASSNVEIIQVEAFTVPAGEERRIREKKLLSKGDIIINGKLIFEYSADQVSSSKETIQLISEQGNVIIGGEIAIVPLAQGQTTKASNVAGVTSVGGSAQQSGGVVLRIRTGHSVEISAPSGNIVLQSSAIIQTENGADGADRFITTFQDYTGRRGGDGGDVILDAPAGAVEFQKGCRIIIGNGGQGESLTLDGSALPTQAAQKRLILQTGQGGNAGEFKIIAARLNFRGQDTASITIEGGKGGGGGRMTSCDFPSVGREFVGFEELVLMGGDGGDGLVQGGHGGNIFCGAFSQPDGLPVINAAGEPTTKIKAKAGDGGLLRGRTVVPSTFPPVQALPNQTLVDTSAYIFVDNAGDGGMAFVRGFSGRHGSSASQARNRHGMKGGDVEVIWGGGGVVSGVGGIDKKGILTGGHGQLTLKQGSSLISLPAGAMPIISAGRGGDGGSGCSSTNGPHDRGGNGGEGGNLILKAGTGGFGDLFQGGDGGHIFRELIRIASGGKGGDGSPPGRGEYPGKDSLFTGSGGKGKTDVGKDGALQGPPFLLPPAAADGRACSSQSPPPSPTPPPPAPRPDPWGGPRAIQDTTSYTDTITKTSIRTGAIVMNSTSSPSVGGGCPRILSCPQSTTPPALLANGVQWTDDDYTHKVERRCTGGASTSTQACVCVRNTCADRYPPDSRPDINEEQTRLRQRCDTTAHRPMQLWRLRCNSP